MRKENKRRILSLLTVAVAIAGLFGTLLGCDSPSSPQSSRLADGKSEGETRLEIGIHGGSQAFGRSSQAIQGIEALFLAVRQIELIGVSGRRSHLLYEPRTVDILAASRQEPVILSDVSVEPGSYRELRLILDEGSLIQVNGELHPLRVPSGTASGLKLKGGFDIPRGRLFSLHIELNTDESVRWNQGTGYRLHPVLRISSGPDVVGIFRGNMTLSGAVGFDETLVQLFNDGAARLRVSSHPNFTIWANYHYNSVTRTLLLDNVSLDAPGLRRRALRRVLRQVPDRLLLPIREWSLDNVIAIDTMGVTANLRRVDEFSFSRNVSLTEFVLRVNVPGSPRIGSDVLTEITFIDTGMPPITVLSSYEGGGGIVERVLVPNDSIGSGSARIRITSFLFEDPDGLNIRQAAFAGRHTFMMSGSHFSASTVNPWLPPPTFTLRRDASGQEFAVSFPRRMNIRMDHGNFTSNNPVISWDAYPGAAGYFVLALVRNRDPATHGNALFMPAFYHFTTGTSARVDSELITFTGTGQRPAQIGRGDLVRIEVFALDGSGVLNSAEMRGALSMDSLTVVR